MWLRAFHSCYRRPRTHVLLPPGASIDVLRPSITGRPVKVLIPTDLMFCAWRQVFPAERMLMLGGRRTGHRVKVTSVSDVSEAHPSSVHVRAEPTKLIPALLDLERAGAYLAAWMHSHPGAGPTATHPSQIDLHQEADFRRHYSDALICIIAVADGHFRLWGTAIDEGRVQVRWQGSGITRLPGESHVFRLDLS